MCVSHIHMWHERQADASPEGEGGGHGGGNTPPSSGRATTEGLSDQIEACALWLPVDDTLVEGFKCATPSPTCPYPYPYPYP